ncbi:uncharacterized protein METZ01_LOCUS263908, partial [marine metagenome]
MSPEELLRKKIHMYDQCVIALGYDPVGKGLSEGAAYLIEFLESECTYLRDGLQEHEDGTHDLWAPFKEMLESDDPDAVIERYKGEEYLQRARYRERMRAHMLAARLLSRPPRAIDTDSDGFV